MADWLNRNEMVEYGAANSSFCHREYFLLFGGESDFPRRQLEG
jgi:hypothetical protein